MNRVTALQNLIQRIGVPVEQKSISAGKIKTNYIAAGTGRPVILLHGAGAGGITWSPVIKPLSAHFHVIVPDIVGYGESDKPSASYDRPFFSTWLKDFCDALGLDKLSMIGNSQGGAIALQFVLDNPNRVERLVLVDSGGLGKEMPQGAFIGLIWMNTFPGKGAAKLLGQYLMHDSHEADPVWDEYLLGVAKMPGGNRVFWQGKGKAVSAIPEEQLRRIEQPTLIIWGKDDRFFPLAHAEFAQRTIPKAQLHIITNAAHLPFLDQPQEFSTTVIKFLDRE